MRRLVLGVLVFVFAAIVAAVRFVAVVVVVVVVRFAEAEVEVPSPVLVAAAAAAAAAAASFDYSTVVAVVAAVIEPVVVVFVATELAVAVDSQLPGSGPAYSLHTPVAAAVVTDEIDASVAAGVDSPQQLPPLSLPWPSFEDWDAAHSVAADEKFAIFASADVEVAAAVSARDSSRERWGMTMAPRWRWGDLHSRQTSFAAAVRLSSLVAGERSCWQYSHS